MPRLKSTRVSQIHQQCQALWIAARGAEQIIPFDTEKEAFRARFVMYDAVKQARDTSNGSPELLDAIINCEAVLRETVPGNPSGAWQVVLRRRAENPFYKKMLNALPVPVAGPEAPSPDQAAQASLDRLLSSLEEEQGE